MKQIPDMAAPFGWQANTQMLRLMRFENKKEIIDRKKGGGVKAHG
jgi:hypothetical protein